MSAQHLQDPDREPIRLAQRVRRGQEGHRRRHRRPLPAAAAAAAAAFGCPWVRSSGRIAHLEEAAPLGGWGGRGSTEETSSRSGWARSAAWSAVQQSPRLHPSSTDATAAAASPGEQHKNLRLPRAARQIAAIGSHTSKGSPRPPNRSSRRDPGAGRAAGGGRRRWWEGRTLKGPCARVAAALAFTTRSTPPLPLKRAALARGSYGGRDFSGTLDSAPYSLWLSFRSLSTLSSHHPGRGWRGQLPARRVCLGCAGLGWGEGV